MRPDSARQLPNDPARGVSVSVVVPTLRERESLERLIPRLEAMARAHQLELQVIVVDDDSRDGTREWLEAMAFPFVQLGVRKGERGLASAVLHGLRAAKHEHLVVMDADLSHPPEKIPSSSPGSWRAPTLQWAPATPRAPRPATTGASCAGSTAAWPPGSPARSPASRIR